MRRILFLVLCVFLGVAPQARGAVEIYAKGHQYDSLQAYLASKKSAALLSPQKELSDTALHQLYVLGVEHGVVDALRDFYSTPVGCSITAEQLQGAIAQAVTRSKEPKLLISQPGKVRIMALTAQDP